MAVVIQGTAVFIGEEHTPVLPDAAVAIVDDELPLPGKIYISPSLDVWRGTAGDVA